MESTLALKKSDYESMLGNFLGYGRGADAGDVAWTDKQLANIKECIDAGCRQVYQPIPIAPGQAPYEWSWLTQFRTLQIASGSTSLLLPDDFDGMQMSLYYTGSNQFGPNLKIVGDAYLFRSRQDAPDQTGVPTMAVISPQRGTSTNEGQRWRLEYWPEADQAYEVQAKYSIIGYALSDECPYAYGGAMMSETIRESCLAIAEETIDANPRVHAAKFMLRLAASIGHDRRFKPQYQGMMQDGSDTPYLPRRHGVDQEWFTYNGVAPSQS